MKNKVFIICDSFGFPNGFASTNRVKNITKGLINRGYDAKILIIHPSETKSKILNKDLKGNFFNIPFEYSSSIIASQIKTIRIIQKIIGSINAIRIILHERDNIEFVLLYIRKSLNLIILGNLCKLFGLTVFLELCEWPNSFISKNFKEKLINNFFTFNVFRWVDGVITISDFISQKLISYNVNHNQNKYLYKLPIIIDPSDYDFKNECTKKTQRGILLFCGNLNNVNILEFIFKSALNLKNEKVNFYLIVIGSSNNLESVNRLYSIINNLGIGDSVKLTGHISKTELVTYYQQADLFLIPLPEDERSIARFPSKIAEYILAEKPFVTTKIGEIEKYFSNNISCYWSEHFNINEYSAVLKFALMNTKEINKKISLAAKEILYNNFHYQKEIDKLISYYKSNQKKK